MAIKVKRKQSRRQAAKEPDQIYTFSERAFNTLERNKKLVLGGIVGVLLAIVVITVIARMSSKSSQAEGAELTEAAMLVDAPIGEAPEDEPDSEGPRFDTKVERAEALREAVAPNLEEAEAPVAARLLDALASLTLGELARAGADFDAVSESENTPLSAAVSLQGAAASEASAGNMEAARQALDQLAERMPELQDYVDFERGRLAEAAGNLDTALATYEAVAASAGLVITDSGLTTGNQALAEAARHRADVLSIVLGRSEEPTPPAEAEMPDEGATEGSE